MLDATISAGILGEDYYDGDGLDFSSLENLTLDHQSALDALFDGTSALALALSQDVTSISATSVTWGDTTHGAVISGMDLTGISTVSELEAAVENATLNGEFDAITFYDAGTAILSLSQTGSELVLSSGGQSIVLSGTVPTDLNGYVSLIDTATLLTDIDVLTAEEITAAVTELSSTDIDSITISDGTDEILAVTLGASELKIEVDGASIALSGTFPMDSLGHIMETILEVDEASDTLDLSDFDDLGITGLTVTDRNGLEIISVTGDVTDDESVSVVNVTIQGTDEEDRDIDAEVIFDSDFTNVVVNLGDEDDEVEIHAGSFLYPNFGIDWVFNPETGIWEQTVISQFGTLPNVSINGEGGEHDEVDISDYISQYISVDYTAGEFKAYIDPIGSDVTFTDLYTFDFSGIERFEIGTSAAVFVTGDEDDNRITLSDAPTYFSIDGGAGTDRVEFHRMYFFDGTTEYDGLTFENFQNLFSVSQEPNGEGYYTVTLAQSEQVIGEFKNIEEVRFSDGQGSTEVVGLNAILGITDIEGTDGDDELIGSSLDDTINGYDGDDYIEAAGGNDIINAGSGYDYIEVEGGEHEIDGGDDWDTVRISDDTSEAMAINLNDGESGEDDAIIGRAGGEQGDEVYYSISLENVERIETDFEGELLFLGDENNNVLKLRLLPESISAFGGDGTDEIQLHSLQIEGDDTYGVTQTEFFTMFSIQAADGDGFSIINNGTGESVGYIEGFEYVRFAGEGDDEDETVSIADILNIELIEGTDGDDDLTGGDIDNTINGYEGDDVIDGNGGDDILNGGPGYDEIYGGDGDDIINTGTGGNDWGGDFVSTGDGDDVVDASQTNYPGISVGRGNNTITGNLSSYLIGDAGILLGFWDVENTGGITVTIGEDGAGSLISGDGTVNATFTGVNGVMGSDESDTITGSDYEFYEAFAGLAGNDIINAGGGFDELRLDWEHNEVHHYDDDAEPAAMTVNLATGVLNDATGHTDQISGFEAVRGSSADDTVISGGAEDYLRFRGLEGDDTFTGSDDVYDHLDYTRDADYGGGAGINVNLATGTIIDGFGNTDTVSGVDKVWGTDFNDVMLGGTDGVTLSSFGGDDDLTGGSGDDFLWGGSGSNTLNGGDGTDTAIIGADYADADTSAANGVVTIAGDQDVWMDDAFDNTITDVEFFEFQDQILSLTQIEGGTDNTDNTVNEDDTDNDIDAGGGDDVVNAGGGDDEIQTGTGDDTANGGDGDDLIFDTTGDDAIDGGDGDDTGVSLSGNNTFTEDDDGTVATDRSINDFYCGGVGNDTFEAGDGNDILIGDVGSNYYFGADTLNGGSGDDLMQGAGNADVFVFETGHGNDVIGQIDVGALFSILGDPNSTIDDAMAAATGADFQIGVDDIDVSAMGLTGLADLTIADNTDGNAVITTGTDSSITLVGVAAADLTADDFIF